MDLASIDVPSCGRLFSPSSPRTLRFMVKPLHANTGTEKLDYMNGFACYLSLCAANRNKYR